MKPDKPKAKFLKFKKVGYDFFVGSDDKILGRKGGSTPVQPPKSNNDNSNTIPFRKK